MKVQDVLDRCIETNEAILEDMPEGKTTADHLKELFPHLEDPEKINTIPQGTAFFAGIQFAWALAELVAVQEEEGS